MIMSYMNYEERLEVAKRLYELSNTEQKTALECIFPELRESEDERIRKEILQSIRDNMVVIHKDECIAWLEKQGQEPRKVSIWKHWKDGICGNGEGKLIYLIKNGDAYSLSSSLGYECDYIELSELDNLMLEKRTEVESYDDIEAEEKDIRKAFNKIWEEKQGEQKPTDEDMKEALRTEYEKGRADTIAQMQKEWSEEDEKCIRLSTDIIDSALRAGFCVQLDRDRCVEWFNSRRPQKQWKPIDEQMTVLELACKYERVFTPKQIDILIGLKEQLKKLKGH